MHLKRKKRFKKKFRKRGKAVFDNGGGWGISEGRERNK